MSCCEGIGINYQLSRQIHEYKYVRCQACKRSYSLRGLVYSSLLEHSTFKHLNKVTVVAWDFYHDNKHGQRDL